MHCHRYEYEFPSLGGAAVVRFQRAQHLAADGVAGQATFRALRMYFVACVRQEGGGC